MMTQTHHAPSRARKRCAILLLMGLVSACTPAMAPPANFSAERERILQGASEGYVMDIAPRPFEQSSDGYHYKAQIFAVDRRRFLSRSMRPAETRKAMLTAHRQTNCRMINPKLRLDRIGQNSIFLTLICPERR